MGASAPMEEVAMDQNIRNLKRNEALSAMRKRRNRNLILGIAGIFGFLLIWEMVVVFEIISPKLIVSPFQVLKTLIAKLTDPRPEGSVLIEHISSSLVVALSGYLLAVCIGVPLGLLMGWYKPLDKLFGPVFEILRPIPPIAWIPFAIIFLGIGLKAKAVIIFLSAFIPSLINSYTGIKLTNSVYVNVSRTCGSSSWRTFLKVGVPSSMPMVFAGMRISLGNSWSTLVAAEMLAANKGLGYMILMGRTFGRIDIIMGGMVMIGILGIIFNIIFDAVENYVLRWRR